MDIMKMTKACSLVAALVLFLNPLEAQAQKKESDKLDIQQLENKYWSAKDDDFSVVQNRAFPKAKRFYATLLGGTPINDPYEIGTATGLNIGYYFSERWGVEATYLNADYRTNDMTTQFEKERGVFPNYNSLKGQTSVQVNYVPLYAKMSFLDTKIIYFDMGVGLILGTTSFRQNIDPKQGEHKHSSAFHYGFSLYQHFFLSQHWALKIDYRNTYTTEERFRYRLPAATPESERSIGNKMINDTMLLFGVTFFL